MGGLTWISGSQVPVRTHTEPSPSPRQGAERRQAPLTRHRARPGILTCQLLTHTWLLSSPHCSVFPPCSSPNYPDPSLSPSKHPIVSCVIAQSITDHSLPLLSQGGNEMWPRLRPLAGKVYINIYPRREVEERAHKNASFGRLAAHHFSAGGQI